MSATLPGYRAAIHRCSKCGLEYAWPRPTLEQLNHFYSSGVEGDDRSPADKRRWAKQLSWGTRREAAFLLNMAGRLRPGSMVVDLGCGNGWHLAEARRRRSEVLGFDVSARALLFAQEGNGIPSDRLHEGLIEDVEVEADSADVVILSQVLEHTLDPQVWIRTAAQSLRPGGVLIAAVPNHGGLEAKLLRSRFGLISPPEHLNYFDIGSLDVLMARDGLRRVRARSRSHFALTRFTRSRPSRLAIFTGNAVVDALLPRLTGRFLYGAYGRMPVTDS
jgi:SAM-dependent methyltransferase